GKMRIANGGTRPQPSPSRIIYGDDAGETNYPSTSILAASARLSGGSNGLVLMATAQPLDQADLPSDQAGVTLGFSSLPMPLIINGLRVVDTKPFSNNIRFHDSLFVGSIVTD